MTTARAIGLVLLVGGLSAFPAPARGNGEHTSGEDAPTRFERFVLSACVPCVRESFAVGTVVAPPLELSAFSRAAAAASRAGEILLDVVRAQQLGRPGWQSVALRATLSVTAGQGGDTYRLGIGLLDGGDVPALAQAVADMAGLASTPPAPNATTADVDFHGGSLRIGLLRRQGASIAYVQAGDVPTLLRRAVWEVPTTLYLPATDLSALAATLRQAVAIIDTLRGD
jgi:hypothetical protein